MDEGLLATAQKYIKERKWEKANDCFEQFIKNNDSPLPETVYATYARSLRISGRTARAGELLAEGKKHYPSSERLLVESHNLYDFLGEWEIAKNVAKKLIKTNPENADYHFRLGRTHSFLQHYEKAKKSYRSALEHKHDIPFHQLTEQIQRSFSDSPGKVQSEYVFIDGKNNLGAFIHQDGKKRFFTKISNYTNQKTGAGREESFYRDICQTFPQLKKLVPRYTDSQIIDKVSYLTIEKIDSIPVEPCHIQQVIETSRQLSSIPYADLAGIVKPPDYVFQFRKGRAISVVHFFTRIHEEACNRKMFQAVGRIMKQYQYPKGIRLLMKRLETAIMDNRLYDSIKPEKHYSLLHGDFAFQNILIDKKDGNPRVIDWASYTVGPHFTDLARFFTSLLLPYAKIKEGYLEKEGKSLEPIERIFFLYGLILFYFQKLGRKGIETELSDFILPALEELEVLVIKFKTANEGDEMTEKLDENGLKIRQLEQKLAVLEDERKHLHKRLDATLNSKSWKLTAPLRLFTERKKLQD